MTDDKDFIRHVDGDVEFVVDLSRYPLVVSTWFGAPTTPLIDAYEAWFQPFAEQCRSRGERIVILDDATHAGRPTPKVRARLAQIETPIDILVDRVVVVRSAAIRGAITALSWMTGDKLRTAKTVREGVADCLEILRQAGISADFDTDNYHRPDRSSAHNSRAAVLDQ